MDLQTLFYAVGIIYMIVALIIVLAIVLLVFYVRRRLIRAKKAVIKSSGSVMFVGSEVVLKTIEKLKKFFSF